MAIFFAYQIIFITLQINYKRKKQFHSPSFLFLFLSFIFWFCLYRHEYCVLALRTLHSTDAHTHTYTDILAYVNTHTHTHSKYDSGLQSRTAHSWGYQSWDTESVENVVKLRGRMASKWIVHSCIHHRYTQWWDAELISSLTFPFLPTRRWI